MTGKSFKSRSPGTHRTQDDVTADTLVADLAALGYRGFGYLKTKRKKDPVQVLLSALGTKCLESRVAEALPWVLLQYPNLDWDSLISAANTRGLQNKLGLLTSIARRIAEKRGESDMAALLREHESNLEKSGLSFEDTFCNDSLTQTERHWLEKNRTDDAKRWRVLTDLSPEHLSY